MKELYEAFRLNEEQVFGKTFLFRGESKNNYHNKANTGQNSRYFAYEIYDGIYSFGSVAIYELLDSSNIFEYEESVLDFVEEFDLLDRKCPILKKLYGINTLRDLDTEAKDYHDVYHSRQIVATDYLENDTNYDGIIWYEEWDTPEYQLQIWNPNILRKVPYKEAKEIIAELKNINPDMYDNSDPWGRVQYELKKR